MTLTKIDRETGEKTVIADDHNDFLTKGVELACKRFGLSGSAWSQANLRLQVNTASGSTNAGPHTISPGVEEGASGTSSTIYSTSSGSLVVRLADTSSNRYRVNTSSGVQPQVSGQSVSRFNAGVSSWGEKGASETWVWTWTVSFVSHTQSGRTWASNFGQIFVDRLTNSGVGTTANYHARATVISSPSSSDYKNGSQAVGNAAVTFSVNPTHSTRWDFKLVRQIAGAAGTRTYKHTRFYLGGAGYGTAQPFLTITKDYTAANNQAANLTLTITFVDDGENI